MKDKMEKSPLVGNGRNGVSPYHTTSRDYICFGKDLSKLKTKMLNSFHNCKYKI